MSRTGKWCLEFLGRADTDFFLCELDDGRELSRSGPYESRLQGYVGADLERGESVEKVREKLQPRELPPPSPRVGGVYPGGLVHSDLVSLIGAGARVPEQFRRDWLLDANHVHPSFDSD